MKTSRNSNLSIMTLLIISVIGICGCSKSENELTGKWINTEDEAIIEYFEDGTLSVPPTNGVAISGNWKILDDGRIKMDLNAFGTSMIVTGVLDGDVLRTSDGESEDIFIRVTKEVKEKLDRKGNIDKNYTEAQTATEEYLASRASAHESGTTLSPIKAAELVGLISKRDGIMPPPGGGDPILLGKGDSNTGAIGVDIVSSDIGKEVIDIHRPQFFSLPSADEKLIGWVNSGLAGSWKLNANNYEGQLEISEIKGKLSGRMYYDIYKRWESLNNVSFDGKIFKAYRPSASQQYTGQLSGNSITGTFTYQGGTYNWNADRAE